MSQAHRPSATDRSARSDLRAAMQAVRDCLPSEHRARASEAAADHLARHFEYLRPRTVALFSSIGSEIDTAPLARILAGRHVALGFPVVHGPGNPLSFRVCELEELELSPKGIPEPPPSAPALPLPDIDIFVVPGLAFDSLGGRLGWGLGYYDQTLIHNPRAPRVGYGFAAQIRSHVPMADWDVPMTELASEKGVVPCRTR